MNKYTVLFLFLLSICATSLYGQNVVLTDLSPNFGTLSLEDMTMVSVTNPGPETVRGTLQSVLRDAGGEIVAEVRSREIVLTTGRQMAFSAIPWSSRPTYGSSSYASTFSRRGVLGQGDFTLCFRFIDDTGNRLGERCAEKRSSLDMNFSLVYPANKSTVRETRPILGWEDISRFGIRASDLSYHLVLVELQKGQSAAEALERNLALVSLQGLRKTSLLYPLNAKQLETGRTYAWMVRAYTNGDQLITSQQWVFSVGGAEVKSLSAPGNTFAMLSTELVNRYYVFDESICLGFDNNEGLTELDYRIIDLDGNDLEVDNLPAISTLIVGLNTLTIPTAGLSLQDNHTYRVVVSTPRKQYYFLHFKYTAL